MKALILAAGRGERMRPLTDTTPKPLLKVAGHHLIEYPLRALQRAGINIAWLGEKIVATLGDGRRYGLQITYSNEHDQALETGGGIYNALPLLGEEAFIVINADVWTNYPITQLVHQPAGLAHLVLVDNPQHHAQGDFILRGDRVSVPSPASDETSLTYSGLGIYTAALFANCQPGIFPLAPILRQAMARGEVSGEYFAGQWSDIGTPERLSALDKQLQE